MAEANGNRHDSGASDVPLREWVDLRFEVQEKAVAAALAAQEKAVAAALTAADRAVLKAELSTEKRFDNVNEFRGALADSARLLMPRAEYESSQRSLTEKVDQNASRLNALMASSRGIAAGWALFAGATSIVISLIMAVVVIVTRTH